MFPLGDKCLYVIFTEESLPYCDYSTPQQTITIALSEQVMELSPIPSAQRPRGPARRRQLAADPGARDGRRG